MTSAWTFGPRAVLILAALALIGVGLHDIQSPASANTVILVATIVDGSGPNTSRLADTVAGGLTQTPGAAGNVVVQRIGRAFTEQDGRQRARAIGRRYGAVLVVWGYRSGLGSDAGLTLEVEDLTRPKTLRRPMANDYAAEVALAEPDHVTFPPLLDGDIRALRSFVEGLIRYDRADYAGAVLDLSAVLERGGPDDFRSKVHVNRGNSFLAWDRLQEAAEDYTKALQLDPNSGGALVNRGVARWGLGQHQQAIEDYDRALQTNPKTTVAYLNRGAGHAANGQHQQAVEDYDRAIGTDPLSAIAYLNRGVSEAVLGRQRQAVRDFSRALRINPVEAAALFNRGLSYAALGDQQRAVADYSRALEMHPRDASAHYHRGIAYSVLRKYEQAIADLSEAIQINPRNAGAYRDRGANHLFLGEHRRAVEDSSRAIELNPRDAEAYFNRGLSYIIQGESRKAIEDMQKVLEMSHDPSLRKYAEEQLQKLRKEQ